MNMTQNSRYSVVRIDNGIRSPHTGIVSNHPTEDAAFAAIDRANKRLRRQAGYARAWHPYAVLDHETGDKREAR